MQEKERDGRNNLTIPNKRLKKGERAEKGGEGKGGIVRPRQEKNPGYICTLYIKAYMHFDI